VRFLKLSLVGLLLVDLPVLLIVAVASLRYGFVDSLNAVLSWRSDHLASYALSPMLLLLLTLRRAR
jgi:hypothetical protein